MVSQDNTRRMQEELLQMEIRRRQMEDLQEHTEESQRQMQENVCQMEEPKRKIEDKNSPNLILMLF